MNKITDKDKEILHQAIKKEVNELKNELRDPSNFHKKDLSDKLSIMKEDTL